MAFSETIFALLENQKIIKITISNSSFHQKSFSIANTYSVQDSYFRKIHPNHKNNTISFEGDKIGLNSKSYTIINYESSTFKKLSEIQPGFSGKFSWIGETSFAYGWIKSFSWPKTYIFSTEGSSMQSPIEGEIISSYSQNYYALIRVMPSQNFLKEIKKYDGEIVDISKFEENRTNEFPYTRNNKISWCLNRDIISKCYRNRIELFDVKNNLFGSLDFPFLTEYESCIFVNSLLITQDQKGKVIFIDLDKRKVTKNPKKNNNDYIYFNDFFYSLDTAQLLKFINNYKTVPMNQLFEPWFPASKDQIYFKKYIYYYNENNIFQYNPISRKYLLVFNTKDKILRVRGYFN